MPTRVTSKTLYQQLYARLYPALQDSRECQAVVQRLLEHYLGIGAVQLVLDTRVSVSAQQRQQIEDAQQQLCRQVPLQYVLGVTSFLGRDFRVTPAVLIPRPETEALVQCIVRENTQSGLRVLDIGTGSGCIAITLQRELLRATVDALDIAEDALAVARANAARLAAPVRFIQADILQSSLPPDQSWDLIVSNPPYVRDAERHVMQPCVVNHEPAQALFVPDHTPLVFHARILALAAMQLAPAGKVYLEINEAFGSAVAQLGIRHGFVQVAVKQDLHGKDRWVVGTKP